MYENFPESQCIKLIEDAEAWMEQHGCKWIRQKGIVNMYRRDDIH